MPGALRLAYVGSPDLHALLHGAAATGAEPTEAFADIVSPSTTIELSRLVPGGWASTLELLHARGRRPRRTGSTCC